MKKLLLSSLLFVAVAFHSNAQVTLFSDDFEDSDISDWTLIDADGDGWDWLPVTMATTAPLYNGMRSMSWSSTDGALTPDNWAISRGIDVGAGNTITLSWDVVARDPDWDLENYSVYVSNGNTDTAMLATTPVFNEVLGGVNVMTTRTVTLPSTLTGTIYVAFRHHDVTDQFVVDVDNVTVTSTSLRNDEFFASNFSVTPNPASDVITIATKNNIPVESVQVLDMNGRVIKEMNATFEDATTMNISEINSGVYFVKVKSQIGVGTTKVVKK